MRTLIVGAGAVGGYFGARLVDADRDVTFLVHAHRAGQLRANGLIVQLPDEPRRQLPVRTVTSTDLRDHYDTVLLAVKSTSLDGAVEDLRPVMRGSATIVPALNGIRHIERLQQAFGPDRIVGGVAVVATELEADGTITQLAPGASLTVGELAGRTSDRVHAIATEYAVPGIEAGASTSITQAMWEKWLFMASGGASTVLLGGPIGRLLAAQDGEAAVRHVIDEAAAVIAAAGHPPRAAAIDRVTGVLTNPGSPFTTSMFRDFAANRPTEVEPILGDLLHVAAAYQVDVPLLRAAAVRLRVHEASR